MPAHAGLAVPQGPDAAIVDFPPGRGADAALTVRKAAYFPPGPTADIIVVV
jgi:hypothetical protein